MAGSSSSTRDVCTPTVSPKVKTTEKKKRKRPSKKVPTTVLESSSTNFMTLVQKLTGSAGELPVANSASPSLGNSVTSSPYSSPSCDYIAPDSFYQHLMRSSAATMAAAASSYDTNDDSSSSLSTYPIINTHSLAAPESAYYTTTTTDDDDFFSTESHPSSSSRALENEISPFTSSSSWRDPMIGSHSSSDQYWYQQLDQSAMRA